MISTHATDITLDTDSRQWPGDFNAGVVALAFPQHISVTVSYKVYFTS